MTNQEAIEILKYLIPIPYRGDGKSTTHLMQTNALIMAIKALEQEPCEEAINRSDVLDAIARIGLRKSGTKEVQAVAECLRAVEALPLVTPQQKYGNNVLDKIKSEIMTERDQFIPETTTYQAFDESIKIINKYKKESEDVNG